MVTQLIALGPEFDHLPDDTEEMLVGATSHQGSINLLYDSLILCGPERGLPWLVGNQLTMIIPRKGGRGPYRPSPDILVHPTLGDVERTSLNVADDGPPVLVIEVASPSTSRSVDLNLQSPTGKPGVYASIGVLEYLVFDPTGSLIADQIQAWRMGPGGYEPWLPEADGRWHSRALGISFVPQGLRLRVYDQDGQLVPTIREIMEARRRDAERVAALEAENRRLRGE
jgi:Uma2 family endonuclease